MELRIRTAQWLSASLLAGSHDWRGRLYAFLRNQRLDARNPLATTKDPLTQTQYGASAGGALRRDRSFLFSNFEQTRLNRAGFITILPANVLAINQELDRIQYPAPRIQTGEFPTGYDTSNYFARIDHQINSDNMLSARYSFYDISSLNGRTVGGLNALSRGSGLEDRDQTIAVNEMASLSPHTINDLRFQFTRSRLRAPVNDRIGPAINISGVAYFGTATFSPIARNNGSRLPFNILTGTDRNNETSVNDRPVGVGRNTGRGFDSASLDVRLSRRFRMAEHVGLEVIAEGFNLLNRTNLELPNNVFGSGTTPLPSFGRATAASDPRQIQFGLRVSF